MVARVWCSVLPLRRHGFFQSRTICGGHTQHGHNSRDNGPQRHEENITRLTKTVTERLFVGNVVLTDIINDYREERVKFEYTNIECISNFIEDQFGIAYDHSELDASIHHDYKDIFKFLAILNLISEEENENRFQINLDLIQHFLYDVLCSMNKALRRLGYAGDEVARQVEIKQTGDMCQTSNSLDRYVRDLELFRSLERLSREMFDRFYARDHKLAESSKVK